MKQRQVISPDAAYTFSDYFKLNAEIEDVLAYFDYTFQAQKLSLPRAEVDDLRIDDLRTRLDDGLPWVGLTSEMARREFLIAPVLWEVVRLTHAKIRVEYTLEVNHQLKGTLDYLLRGQRNMMVVEAKNGDLTRGFTQLAVELIALDKWEDETPEVLYGAVSMGDIWQFGVLHRAQRLIQQDLNLFRVPDDLKDVLGILVACLTGK